MLCDWLSHAHAKPWAWHPQAALAAASGWWMSAWFLGARAGCVASPPAGGVLAEQARRQERQPTGAAEQPPVPGGPRNAQLLRGRIAVVELPQRRLRRVARTRFHQVPLVQRQANAGRHEQQPQSARNRHGFLRV